MAYVQPQDFLWVEKYRPKTIKDTILPKQLRKRFEAYVKNGQIPHLLLAGSPGMGKTTVARAMLEQIGADYKIINGSLDLDKDKLRNDIMQFASTVSFEGGRKYVIIDEADNMNAEHVQKPLRNFMETFSRNCGFILTVNYKAKIIDALHSRCALETFEIPEDEKDTIQAKQFKAASKILEAEGVEFDPQVVIQLIRKFFPDFRKLLNELQKYASTNEKIDTGILSIRKNGSVSKLIELLKEKDFTTIRQWVADNSSIEQTQLYLDLYKALATELTSNSLALVTIKLADYQQRAAFAVQPEINIAACLVEIMVEAEWL